MPEKPAPEAINLYISCILSKSMAAVNENQLLDDQSFDFSTAGPCSFIVFSQALIHIRILVKSRPI